MSRFVAILLAAALVQSFAFVAPGAPRHALRSTRYEQMQQQTEMPEETSSPPFAAVLMASFVGLMLGFTSSPNVARAEEAAAPVVSDKKAKLKAEVEKAQAAIKKNAKSKEERLKEQIAQLKEVEKTAETDFATKWGALVFTQDRLWLACQCPAAVEVLGPQKITAVRHDFLASRATLGCAWSIDGVADFQAKCQKWVCKDLLSAEAQDSRLFVWLEFLSLASVKSTHTSHSNFRHRYSIWLGWHGAAGILKTAWCDVSYSSCIYIICISSFLPTALRFAQSPLSDSVLSLYHSLLLRSFNVVLPISSKCAFRDPLQIRTYFPRALYCRWWPWWPCSCAVLLVLDVIVPWGWLCWHLKPSEFSSRRLVEIEPHFWILCDRWAIRNTCPVLRHIWIQQISSN